MLKLFFHRDSKFVHAIEAIGAVLFIPMIIRGDVGVIFWLYLFAYLFIRFCYSFNWYRSFKGDSGPSTKLGASRWTGDRGQGTGESTDELGIRLHFKKALVAASYIIFIVNLASLLTMSKVFIYAGAAMFAPIIYLNVILLYLHLCDKDERPPNYFSECTTNIGKPL